MTCLLLVVPQRSKAHLTYCALHVTKRGPFVLYPNDFENGSLFLRGKGLACFCFGGKKSRRAQVSGLCLSASIADVCACVCAYKNDRPSDPVKWEVR